MTNNIIIGIDFVEFESGDDVSGLPNWIRCMAVGSKRFALCCLECHFCKCSNPLLSFIMLIVFVLTVNV